MGPSFDLALFVAARSIEKYLMLISMSRELVLVANFLIRYRGWLLAEL